MSTSQPQQPLPFDASHLDRATFGDRALQRELLSMFHSQISEARLHLVSAGAEERGRIAHAVKGAARGLGAFEIGDCAADIERDPAEEALIERFEVLAERMEAAIRGWTG